MQAVEELINKFGGWTESYFFYNGEVELRYDPKEHLYFLIQDGKLTPVSGVSTITHIVDKSSALIPWGVKMSMEKLLRLIPILTLPTGEKQVGALTLDELNGLIAEAKTAPKDKLEEAGDIGSIAHAWLETYAKSQIAGTDEYKTLAWPLDEKATSCCKAGLKWITDHNVRFTYAERKVYSCEHNYAGTLDAIGLVDSCSDPLCCPERFTDRLSLIDWKSSNYLYIEYLFQTAGYEHAVEEELKLDIVDRWVNRLGKLDGEYEPWHLGPESFKDDFDGFLNCLALSRSVLAVESRMRAVRIHIKDEKKKARDAAKAAKLAAEKQAKAEAKAAKKAQKEQDKAILKELAWAAKVQKKAEKQKQKEEAKAAKKESQ
jgi:hypothetical protein